MLPAPLFAVGLLSTLADIVIVGLAALGGLTAAAVGALALRDRYQKSDALRHNFPVLGRLIPFIDHFFGPFVRNRIIAPDNQQFPSNRIQRDWAKQLASGKPLAMTAHGSKDDIHRPGKFLFPPGKRGLRDSQKKQTPSLVIGPYCRQPYTARSIFNISAMSHGSLGRNAVTTLSKGAKLADCWLNTGEGGLTKYHMAGGCDLIYQLGTANYGLRDKNGRVDMEQVKNEVGANPLVVAMEVKDSGQGAKPCKGGILPGKKVTAEIAEIRDIPEGEPSLSPDCNPEFSTDEELINFINRLRDVSGKPVGIKGVYNEREYVEDLCKEILRQGIERAPDFITIDGGEGGSGAAPNILMSSCGLSITESLPMLTEVLVEYGLKDRIRIIASGGLGTTDAAAWALCAGADFVNAARGFKRAMGCVGAHECDLGTCPAGITTHDEELQKALDPEIYKEKVANYAKGTRNELETLAHSCGLAHPRLFRPKHVKIAQADGMTSKRLTEYFPNLKF